MLVLLLQLLLLLRPLLEGEGLIRELNASPEPWPQLSAWHCERRKTARGPTESGSKDRRRLLLLLFGLLVWKGVPSAEASPPKGEASGRYSSSSAEDLGLQKRPHILRFLSPLASILHLEDAGERKLYRLQFASLLFYNVESGGDL